MAPSARARLRRGQHGRRHRTGGLITSFAAATALTDLGDGAFAAHISEPWSIGGRPNGGYLLAILGHAAIAASPHDHVIVASAHYLRAPEVGPVTVRVDVLRAGRTMSEVRAQLWQADRLCIEALVTSGHLDADATPYWDAGAPRADPVALDDTTRLPSRLPTMERSQLFEHVTIALDPESAGFVTNQPSGRGELRGWVSLPGDAPYDSLSLLFAVDCFPAATNDLAPAGWVPTLALTAYIRALPAPGPVWVVQRAQLVDGGRVDETCFVWDHEGRLVAQATQLAAVRLEGEPRQDRPPA